VTISLPNRAVAAFPNKRSGAIVGLFARATILAVSTGGAFLSRAGDVSASADSLDAIVVTAKRRADAAADETMKGHVAAALRSDPFFYDEHVTVTISNGVVTLQGMVFDDWDLRNAMRIARKIPGVRRVVNDLEIKLGGE
jgi:hyperosmotically inducible protein